jgi:hypothetical protein
MENYRNGRVVDLKGEVLFLQFDNTAFQKDEIFLNHNNVERG